VIADVERISDPALRGEAQQLLSAYEAGEAVVVTDGVWIALAETHDRYFAPGMDYHYSNVNYQVLGMILEHLTGSPLADLLAREIGAPLGLESTWLAPADVSTPGMRGYDATRELGQLVDVTDDITWFGNGGNGGVVSTADELLAVMSAIVSGELLSNDLTTQMKTANLADYGLGLATYRLSCGTFYGHAGSVLGTRSIAVVSDDGRDGVVAALNVYSERDSQLASLADTLLCRI
jgi:D-alanyl-D-alanine carboxypeptidase